MIYHNESSTGSKSEMWVHNCVFVIFLNFCCFFLEITASSNSQELLLLPRIFHLNESEKCPDDHYYCKVDVKLQPKNAESPPEIWKLIQKQFVYKRDMVYRAFCIGDESIEEKLEHELIDFSLKGDVVKSYCYRKENFFDIYGSREILIGILIMAYLGFIIFSTIKTYNPKNNANRYQQIFSLINIWKELNEPKRNEDFKNLLSFQGMRTFTMAYIVGVHTVYTLLVMTFIKNPEYFEEVPDTSIKSILHGSFGLIVHIFFVISAWLLSVQLHNIVRKNGKLTIKDLLILWLNRYFRLLPALAFIILLVTSDAVAVAGSDPYFYSLTRSEVTRCRVIGWKNLLFLHNVNVDENGMCSPGMWFVAADLHMYIISSTFFYISKRFKISIKYFFALMILAAMSIQIFNVLTTDFDGIFRFSARILPPENIVFNPVVIFSYVNTYTNAASYIIGFIFGTIYSCNKKRIIFDTTMKKIFGYVLFFGLPILASYLNGFRPNRVMEALIAVSLRPLFSLGIAVGLLAMVNGGRDLMKNIFESSIMVFLGTFTYSTYMFHFIVVFGRGTFKARYIELSDSYTFGLWIIDLISSFSIGMVMYIILEHPCLRLQKILLPQIKEKIKENKEK